MAAAAGRKITVLYDADGAGVGTPVAVSGETAATITINNEPIDITDKSAAGVRTLLDDIGTKAVEISLSGYLTDTTLAALAFAATENAALHTFEVDVDVLYTLNGDWFIASFETTGEEGANAMQFSMTLQSSGAITYTAD